MGSEPLTIINFKNLPYSSADIPFKLSFSITITQNAELTAEKAKRLVRELEEKLKNFRHEWNGIKASFSDLDEFFIHRISDRSVKGGWSLHLHAAFLSADEETRRQDFGRVPSLLSKELKSWTISHYATFLKVYNVETK